MESSVEVVLQLKAMDRSQIGSVSSSDLIDAKLEEHQMRGTKRCPNCGHQLDSRPDWVGLPAGVKFDPTDQELIEHLEAKVRSEDYKSHPLIDEFILTIEGEDGICYTHPEKLPGVSKDGLNKHFFHRPSKAYTTGTRKRRKIQTDCDLQGCETRWHKTGKTRPVMVNGKQKGCKKILVLYTNFGKHRKPEKTNWVMHQYHLGEYEEEKEGELVVSKIFYQTQPRQCNWSERVAAVAAATVGEQCLEHRRDSGSGSSSSREVVSIRDELSSVAGISSYGVMEHHIGQHMKNDNFNFVPFRKSFEEVDMGEATIAKAREVSNHTCDDHEDQNHHATVAHRQAIATAAYHINNPSHPISGILAPMPLQQSIVSLEAPYHRLLLQQQEQQQHQKLVGRPTSGLEEFIIGCNASGLRGEMSIPNPQEAEWLKYQYCWSDPDNQAHHG